MASVVALEQRVQVLEGAAAAATADGAAGRAAVKQARAALAALEWRVDMVGGARQGCGGEPCYCCLPTACPPLLVLTASRLLHAVRLNVSLPPTRLQSSDATVSTLKALESRQDLLRSEVHSAAATTHLADAKVASLAAEVVHLQRRVHGGSPLSPGRRPDFRLV